jgi:zinc transport system substrate-binding protein
LRQTILNKKVRVLFTEPQFSPRILQSVAQETNVPVAVIDPMETGEASAGYYEKVMRQNLQSLTQALR